MNMRTLAVRSIRAYPVRFVATVLAVVVGTGFLAGALVLRDSLGASLEATTRQQLRGVDAVVQNAGGLTVAGGQEATTGTTGATPGARRESANVRAEDSSPTGGTRQLGVNQNVPAPVLATVRPVAGVQTAAGVLQGYISVLDGRGEAIAENVNGSLWIEPAELNPYRVVEGRAPASAGEIAIDAYTAGESGLAPGGQVTLATGQGRREATVVGIVNYGDQPSSGQGDVLLSEPDAFAWLNAGREEYQAIYVAAAEGTAPAALVGSLRSALGAVYEVETGDRLREAAAEGLGGVVDVLGYGLVGFALVALFVALFTIYNTFSIVVHQRTREFALLRALGAGGRQIKRSVRVEAVVVGFVSSLVGFGAGVLLFEALTRLVPQFRDIVGIVTLRVTAPSVLIVLACGTLVTVLSAVIPAWRAARSKPVEALRESAVDVSGTSRPRAVIGLGLLALGSVILVVGSLASQFLVMAVAPPLLFLGVVVGGPVLAALFGRTVQVVLRPLRGATVRLGVENVQRNPRRSAATALALVIGVFLVVLVTAGGGAVRDYAVGQLSKLGGPDVTVTAFSGELPADLAGKVRDLDGVASVAEVYFAAAETGSEGFPVSAVDYGNLDALGLRFEEGAPERLGPDDLVIPELLTQPELSGSAQPLGLGDAVVVRFGNGETRSLRVGAIAQTSFPPFVYMSEQVAREVDPALVPMMLYATAESGQIQSVINSATGLAREYAGIDVSPGNFFAQAIKGFFNFVIAAVDGLLLVAVVIALFGIVNTLVLSVSERRHEIGLLRAIGMTRAQVRATITLESIAVSLLGALVGTTFGLFVAWCLTRPVLRDGEGAAGFSWPVGQLLLIGVLTVIVGVLASIAPARRAARLNIIEAVTIE